MSESPHCKVEIHELPSEDSWRSSRVVAPRVFQGVVERSQGARLVVRVDCEETPVPFGTLVEIRSPERLYLGEVKFFLNGLVFIDFEHQVDRTVFREIGAAWGRDTLIS